MSRISKPAPDDGALLVNKLSVKDAIHIVRLEGGELSAGRVVFRLLTVLVIAAFTGRAIVLGQATAWHLFLPMLGEYLVILLTLPFISLMIQDPALQKDAKQSVRLIIALIVIGAIWIASRCFASELPFPQQAKLEFSRLIEWITSHEMHWPIIGASLGMLMGILGRVAAFHRHGPPFVGVGMGCAMRFIIPLLGCFLLPFIASGAFPLVWVIWAILLLAELGSLLMHWDLQRRLAKRGIVV